MKRKNNPGEASARGAARELPPDMGRLLAEIEKEPVPEKLLELARQLQQALLRERAEEAEQMCPPTRHAGRG